MITPMRMSAPTPKSMPWPQRPAQAAPVRRESVPAGGAESGAKEGGIHPSFWFTSADPAANGGQWYDPFSPDDSD
jgi:hypothetical protein